MADRPIPAPLVNPETEPFWAAAKEGKFLVKACTECGKAHWYPRALCPHCGSAKTVWRAGTGTGTIYSLSVMKRAPEVYAVAYVTLKAAIALGLWGAAAIGYGRAPLYWWERVLATAAALFLVVALPVTDEVGFALAALVAGLHAWRTHRAEVPAVG